MPKKQPTLDSQIEALQAEIGAFEAQIAKLSDERQALQSTVIKPSSNTPEAKAAAAQEEVAIRTQNRPIIEGLTEAIARLSDELGGKRLALQQLQSQQSQRIKEQRMQEAKEAIASHIERIQQAANVLEGELFALKDTWQENRVAFIEGQTDPYAGNPPGAGYHWRPTELVMFDFASVPSLEQKDSGFVLAARRVPLFAVENEQAQQERIARQVAAEKERQEARRQRTRDRLTSQIEVVIIERDSITSEIAEMQGKTRFEDQQRLASLQNGLTVATEKLEELEAQLQALDG